MRTVYTCVVLCVLIGSACAFPPLWDDDIHVDSDSSFVNYALQRRGKDTEKEAIIVAKLFVPARIHDDFISAWEKLEDSTKDEDGNLLYDLKKTATDNELFLVYGQWKSWGDYMSHVESKYFEEYMDFLTDNKIEFRIVPMKKVSRADIYPKERKESKDFMHVVFGFWVDPGHHDDFIKRWEVLADCTRKEKAVHTFALRKSEIDNMVFSVYGTWDSVEDFHKHHWSKHAQDFRDYKAKHNIVWKMWPLEKVGSQPE